MSDNKCEHKKWHWEIYSCSVICNDCGAWHSASVSQGEDNFYQIELHGDDGWHEETK